MATARALAAAATAGLLAYRLLLRPWHLRWGVSEAEARGAMPGDKLIAKPTPAAGAAVASFDDPRLSYYNLAMRGPYPEADIPRWYVAGIPAYNHGVRLARGRWIAPHADDDALRPHHLSTLLEAATSRRLEVAYGRMMRHAPDGATEVLCTFPPRFAQFGLQSTLYHAELRVFELELADALFELSGDWGWCQRLLRAGARIGMVDEVVTDYYPSRLWQPRRAE